MAERVGDRLARLEQQLRRTQRALDALRTGGVFHVRDHSVIIEALDASALVATDANKVLTSGGAIAWTDWTPSVTQSGSVAVAVNNARYVLVSNVAHVAARLTVTGSGTAGSAINIGGIPTAITPKYSGTVVTVGTGAVTDASESTTYVGIVISIASGFQLRDTATQGYIGANPSFGLASDDVLAFNATYEVA